MSKISINGHTYTMEELSAMELPVASVGGD